ncbi:MAG TPA: hypothetical protein VII30_03065 [Gemmatimonadaceae bacterium]
MFDAADPTEVLALLKSMSGALEAYVAYSFQLTRESKVFGTQWVTVTILDAGPQNPTRFHVSAQTRDNQKASGNPANTLESALAQVHWGDLDKPSRGEPPAHDPFYLR